MFILAVSRADNETGDTAVIPEHFLLISSIMHLDSTDTICKSCLALTCLLLLKKMIVFFVVRTALFSIYQKFKRFFDNKLRNGNVNFLSGMSMNTVFYSYLFPSSNLILNLNSDSCYLQ
jgi:hypothetical protein